MALVIESVEHTFNNPVTGDDSGTNFTENYLVLFTAASIAAASAAELSHAESIAFFANGVPQRGQQNSFNRAAFCKSKSTSALVSDNKPVGVKVSCVYSTIGSNKKDQEDNPLNKLPDVTWNHISEREAMINARRIRMFQGGQQRIEKNGNVNRAFINVNGFDLAILNSFGAPFGTQPEREVYYQTCTIVENVITYSRREARDVLGSVNDAPYSVYGEPVEEEEAMCITRSAQNRYLGQFSYWEQTTVLLFKPTHDSIVLDNGDMGYIEESQEYRSGIDDGGELTRDGVQVVKRLDGKGNELEDKKDSVFLHFATAPIRDHNLLNLPKQRL